MGWIIIIYWVIRGFIEGNRFADTRFPLNMGYYHMLRLIEASLVFVLMVWVDYNIVTLLGFWLIGVFFYHRAFALAFRRFLMPDGDYRFLWFRIKYTKSQRFLFEFLHLIIGYALFVGAK